MRKLVQHLRKHGIPIAVATSSGRLRYEKKVGHLAEVFDCFEGNIVCADDERWKEIAMKAKPAPDIFLVAARELLGRDVGEPGPVSEDQILERKKGLVFEDGFAGVQAGKRAGMNGPFISLYTKHQWLMEYQWYGYQIAIFWAWSILETKRQMPLSDPSMISFPRNGAFRPMTGSSFAFIRVLSAYFTFRKL